MSRGLPPVGRGVLLVASTLILGYGLWSLYAGWVLSTWGRVEFRPSLFYWITVVALLVIGTLNIAIALRCRPKS